MAIKKGVTSSGFEFEIDDAVIDDMELIDAIADAILNGDTVKQHRTTGFDTPEAFMNAREKIIERR